ncbi:hypothetical protein M5X00_28210 [Paenibacillus alvei]|uniref:hypothetical protein n=1 Tax=Paenibacillus alvei TaxID=44250 RepID=UPI0021D23671|nr:hypothetical protein [Paenibacillus alvei]MCY9539869.1 hypothetical protein [Paenibacillus alvei]MCY9708682.1 hypothetical protein [Paenibacillus alvei]MCY9737267.1 hypothetical protein [Paenibacillus alvei]MCY9758113.1 hypothetical protein [Paenibacillus alvei]MEC0083075.1 hypothetical protein [Paenibacillus alvei]
MTRLGVPCKRNSILGVVCIAFLILCTVFSPFIVEEERVIWNNPSKLTKSFHEQQFTAVSRHTSTMKHLLVKKIVFMFILFFQHFIFSMPLVIKYLHSSFFVMRKRLFLMPIKFTSTFVV